MLGEMLMLMVVLKPEGLAICLRIDPKSASVWNEESRRRDADGGGRDDRAPQKVGNDSGFKKMRGFCIVLGCGSVQSWRFYATG